MSRVRKHQSPTNVNDGTVLKEITRPQADVTVESKDRGEVTIILRIELDDVRTDSKKEADPSSTDERRGWEITKLLIPVFVTILVGGVIGLYFNKILENYKGKQATSLALTQDYVQAKQTGYMQIEAQLTKLKQDWPPSVSGKVGTQLNPAILDLVGISTAEDNNRMFLDSTVTSTLQRLYDFCDEQPKDGKVAPPSQVEGLVNNVEDAMSKDLDTALQQQGK